METSPFAFEFQRADGFTSKPVPFDGSVVESCQAEWIAKANKETLIGVYAAPHGIHRRILYRPA